MMERTKAILAVIFFIATLLFSEQQTFGGRKQERHRESHPSTEKVYDTIKSTNHIIQPGNTK